MASVSPKHDTFPLIVASGEFAVSVLAGDQVAAGQYFSYPGRKFRYLADEFLDVFPGTELPVVRDAISWLRCEVFDTKALSDHVLFFTRVVAVHAGRLKEPPLLYSSRLGWRIAGDKAASRARRFATVCSPAWLRWASTMPTSPKEATTNDPAPRRFSTGASTLPGGAPHHHGGRSPAQRPPARDRPLVPGRCRRCRAIGVRAVSRASFAAATAEHEAPARSGKYPVILSRTGAPACASRTRWRARRSPLGRDRGVVGSSRRCLGGLAAGHPHRRPHQRGRIALPTHIWCCTCCSAAPTRSPSHPPATTPSTTTGSCWPGTRTEPSPRSPPQRAAEASRPMSVCVPWSASRPTHAP